MRIIFAGSPAIAVACLEAAVKTEGIELVGVITNPDTPKGRQGTPLPTEVGDAAQRILRRYEEQGKNSFPVLKPQKLDAAFRELVSSLKPDLLVSFAYGRLFGPKFLALFPIGGINIHPSLLPLYRGPTPIQAAILNRDSVTGISIQKLADKMDCGDILAQERIQLTGAETAASLSAIAADKAASMLPALLKNIAQGNVLGQPQNDSEAAYCTLLTRDDGLIDWSRSAAEIEAKIRAYDPWPLCRTIHNGRELLLLESAVYENPAGVTGGKAAAVLGASVDKQDGILIQTGEGILIVKKLQYHAKKALYWKDFLNGARGFIGSQLG